MEWLLPIIICVLVGIILMVVEVFMPGFGIPGVSGFVLLVAGIVMTWIEYGAKVGLGMAVIVLALMGFLISISLRSVEEGRFSKSLVLHGTQEPTEDKDMQVLIGQQGTVITPLRPVGTAEFACGKLNVSSDGEYIEKGVKVRIERINGTTILVTNAYI